MKIFLLNAESPFFRKEGALHCNRVYPPIALAIIAQGLEHAGHDIRLVDAHAMHWKDREVLDAIGQFRPDLFIYSSEHHDSRQLPVPGLDLISSFFNTGSGSGILARTTVLIGPHGALFPEKTLETIPGIDFVIQGEAEQKVLDFVHALDQGDPRSARGICYLTTEGTMRSTPNPGPGEDLDSLPLPAYHLLPMHLYRDEFVPDRRFSVVATSQGYTMNGPSGSSMNGTGRRTRSTDHVLHELDLLVRHYGVGHIFFSDLLFLSERERIQALLQAMIDRKYKITWRCRTRAHIVERAILELMKRAGCTTMHISLETTASTLQDAPDQGNADKDRFRKMHALGQELGISMVPDMAIGWPNESHETVIENTRFYHSLGFQFVPSLLIPYPDTGLCEFGLSSGKSVCEDWDAMVSAAGVIDNYLTGKELESILAEVDTGNRRLNPMSPTCKQKASGKARNVWLNLKEKLGLA